jgi:hypothetical protein
MQKHACGGLRRVRRPVRCGRAGRRLRPPPRAPCLTPPRARRPRFHLYDCGSRTLFSGLPVAGCESCPRVRPRPCSGNPGGAADAGTDAACGAQCTRQCLCAGGPVSCHSGRVKRRKRDAAAAARGGAAGHVAATPPPAHGPAVPRTGDPAQAAPSAGAAPLRRALQQPRAGEPCSNAPSAPWGGPARAQPEEPQQPGAAPSWRAQLPPPAAAPPSGAAAGAAAAAAPGDVASQLHDFIYAAAAPALVAATPAAIRNAHVTAVALAAAAAASAYAGALVLCLQNPPEQLPAGRAAGVPPLFPLPQEAPLPPLMPAPAANASSEQHGNLLRWTAAQLAPPPPGPPPSTAGSGADNLMAAVTAVAELTRMQLPMPAAVPPTASVPPQPPGAGSTAQVSASTAALIEALKQALAARAAGRCAAVRP